LCVFEARLILGHVVLMSVAVAEPDADYVSRRNRSESRTGGYDQRPRRRKPVRLRPALRQSYSYC